MRTRPTIHCALRIANVLILAKIVQMSQRASRAEGTYAASIVAKMKVMMVKSIRSCGDIYASGGQSRPTSAFKNPKNDGGFLEPENAKNQT